MGEGSLQLQWGVEAAVCSLSTVSEPVGSAWACSGRATAAHGTGGCMVQSQGSGQCEAHLEWLTAS